MLQTIEFKFSYCTLQVLNDFYSSSDKAGIPPHQCHLTTDLWQWTCEEKK